MDLETLRAHLRGTLLSGLLAAIPSAHEHASELESEDIRGLLRIWSHEKEGFTDLMADAKSVLDVYVKHKVSLPLDQLRGSVRYLIGVMERRLDRSGFVYLGSSAHLAVSIELVDVADRLREADPAGAAVLDGLARLLRAVEGAEHSVYTLLRGVGDRHLADIEWCMGGMTPTNADMVLHALDGFTGNADVIALYERMIDRLPEGHSLREDFEKYLQRVRG